MEKEKSLSRREFLGQTTLLASAATVAAGAKKTRAQLNNAAVPPPARLGVGFIGAGIRGNILMESSMEIAGIKPVIVCDLYDGHLGRAKEIAGSALPTTKAYEEVLSRSDVDAVVISVPDHWHKKVLLDALAAGKHAYIEKPLTHRYEDGEDMIRAVDKSKKVVQVGSQYLSMACAQKAVEFIQKGKLGQITMVEGQTLRNSSTGAWYYPIPPDASPQTIDWKRFIGDSKWYDFDPKRFFQWRLFWDYSGGLPTDLFVHLISATHQLMGVSAPDSVVAFGDIYRWKNYRDVPDQMCAMAAYPEGFMLKLTATNNNSHSVPPLTFYGTEGTLEYSGDSMKFYFEPRQENYRYPTNSWETKTVKQFAEIMNLDKNLSPIINPPPKAEPVEYSKEGGEDSTTAHLRNFYDAIRNGKKPIEEIRFGVNAVNVGHMTNISFKAGKIVRWNKNTRKVEV
ncbi:MAG TPA: Gfo/Idh/MocA family oxidoreductase [archaeon]|nr:Gfo/Idh/MocA family oxidoreductase [archaeon]